MKQVIFDVQNCSDGRVPFSYVCVLRGVGTIIHEGLTDNSYDPGERVTITVNWRLEEYVPHQCVWKARPAHSRKWIIHRAIVKDDGGEKNLVASVPCLFG